VTATTPPDAAIPIACSLNESELRNRGEEWAAMLAEAISRTAIDDGARIGFRPDPTVAARLADLALREQHCCPFFSFTIEIAAGILALSVTAPAAAGPMVDHLLAGC
jgi:hypothetical protein